MLGSSELVAALLYLSNGYYQIMLKFAHSYLSVPESPALRHSGDPETATTGRRYTYGTDENTANRTFVNIKEVMHLLVSDAT